MLDSELKHSWLEHHGLVQEHLTSEELDFLRSLRILSIEFGYGYKVFNKEKRNYERDLVENSDLQQYTDPIFRTLYEMQYHGYFDVYGTIYSKIRQMSFELSGVTAQKSSDLIRDFLKNAACKEQFILIMKRNPKSAVFKFLADFVNALFLIAKEKYVEAFDQVQRNKAFVLIGRL